VATLAVLAVILAVILVVREQASARTLAGLRRELSESHALLKEYDGMAHVGQFVSGFAQELKAPLQGVIGNTELMLASAAPGTESAADLREIQQSAARAAGIVRNLLAFTETTNLSRHWQHLNDIVGRSVAACRLELEASGLRVQITYGDHMPLVYVDGRQLEKVMTTLLARPSPRAMPARGGTDVVLVTSRGADDKLVIECDDRTAASMDDASWSGELAACRQIVEAHGGSLEIRSPADGGFRFHLELPVSATGVGAAAGSRR
jgi:signal transduction histidine kinase